MGMGYAGAFAEVIEESFIREQCPQELENFKNVLDEAEGETLESFAINLEQGIDNDNPILKAYSLLCGAFQNKTDLELSLSYHDQENDGDRYDDVDGAFWQVDGVYQLTKAGEKFKEKIKRCFFVQFG